MSSPKTILAPISLVLPVLGALSRWRRWVYATQRIQDVFLPAKRTGLLTLFAMPDHMNDWWPTTITGAAVCYYESVGFPHLLQYLIPTTIERSINDTTSLITLEEQSYMRGAEYMNPDAPLHPTMRPVAAARKSIFQLIQKLSVSQNLGMCFYSILLRIVSKALVYPLVTVMTRILFKKESRKMNELKDVLMSTSLQNLYGGFELVVIFEILRAVASFLSSTAAVSLLRKALESLEATATDLKTKQSKFSNDIEAWTQMAPKALAHFGLSNFLSAISRILAPMVFAVFLQAFLTFIVVNRRLSAPARLPSITEALRSFVSGFFCSDISFM